MKHTRMSVRSAILLAAVTLFFPIVTSMAEADDWPQWRGEHRDGVWRETGLLEVFPKAQIESVWEVPIGSGYSAPIVAEGRVYLTDRIEDPDEVERVLCRDAKTGKELWTQSYPSPYKGLSYPDGPRAAVTIADGLAFSLGAFGHFRCFDAVTGALQWKKDPGTDYEIELPIWGITAAPLVEGALVIAQLGAVPGACIVAWDKKTGEERWRALEDVASYSAPVMIEQAGQRVLLCWTGENLVGMNPATGEVHWKHATPPTQMVINVPSPVVDGNRIFLSSFYDGAQVLQFETDSLTAKPIWQRQMESGKPGDALHAMISTPILQGDYIYGVDDYGQLRCLDANTGERIWEDLTAVPKARWATIHMVRNGDKVWMFNERGELIIAKLSPTGFEELSRAKLIEPTTGQLNSRQGVCWAHPAYANKHVFARNDSVLLCASLAAE